MTSNTRNKRARQPLHHGYLGVWLPAGEAYLGTGLLGP